jgi:hypothetical protein
MGEAIIRDRSLSWLALSIAFIGCQRGEESHKRMMSEPVRREQKHAFRPPYHRDVPADPLRRGRWDEIAYSDSKLQNP